MNQEIRNWQLTTFRETLKKMGLKEDSVVVDFGSGEGNYTVSMAEYIRKGKVYAIDHSSWVMNRLYENKKKYGLDTLVIERNLDHVEIGSVDALFVCDLYHMLRNRKERVKEWKKVLKDDGLLVIAPFHMCGNEISNMMRELEGYGFRLKDVMNHAAIHFEMQMYVGSVNDPLAEYEHGPLYIFMKGK